MRRPAALIVGGGPAGSAAAIALARAGARAVLLERDRETRDAVCGGFLSWRTLDALGGLGVDVRALGAPVVTRTRVFAGGRRLEARLPAPAAGLSRRALDTALLARAGAAGAGIERGVTVRACEDGLVRLADGAELAPEALFLATGKHDMRGLSRPRVSADPAMGLRTRLAPSAALARLIDGAVELHAVRGGYAGLVLQEDGTANLCLAIRRSRLREAGNDPLALLMQLAGEQTSLRARFDAAGGIGAIDAVAQVPYGWRATAGTAGLFRLGDQAGVIPSLAGEGVSIALASGSAAAAAWLAGGAAAGARFQPSFARRLWLPIGLARLLRAAIERPTLAEPLLALAPSALLRPLATLTRVADRPALVRAGLSA